jgi:YD repeat-containing protein
MLPQVGLRMVNASSIRLICRCVIRILIIANLLLTLLTSEPGKHGRWQMAKPRPGILADGSKIHYEGTPGSYEHTSTPTAFYKSTLTSNQTGYDLKFKDGTIYHFFFKAVIDYPYSHWMRAGLEWIQDRNGNRLVIERDNTVDVRITRITSPNNRWVEFSYDGSSARISQVTDNIGRAVSYTYDASGRLWKVTNPMGGVTEYTYDASHRMTSIKNPRGIVYVTNGMHPSPTVAPDLGRETKFERPLREEAEKRRNIAYGAAAIGTFVIAGVVAGPALVVRAVIFAFGF